MCESHRAITDVGRHVVDLCAPCLLESQKATIRAKSDVQARVEQARSHIREIAEHLIRAGVVPRDKYYHATTVKRTLFGGERVVENPSGHLFGWYIGDFYWSQRDNRADSVSEHRMLERTFLTTEGEITPERSDRSVVVGPAAENVYANIVDPASSATFWETVAGAADALADRCGIGRQL
jgi:hypothetical protein